MKKNDNIMELLNELHSIPETYSQLSKSITRVYSNNTIEKIKKSVNKKVHFSRLEEVCKMKELDTDNKSNYDDYIEIQTNDKSGIIPTIRILQHQNINKTLSQNINCELGTIKEDPKMTLHKKQYQKELERYNYLRRYNENRFMRILKVRMNHLSRLPEIGHYTPNYNAIYKRTPNIILEYPHYSPKKPKVEVSPKENTPVESQANNVSINSVSTSFAEKKEKKNLRRSKSDLPKVLTPSNSQIILRSKKKEGSLKKIKKVKHSQTDRVKDLKCFSFKKMQGRDTDIKVDNIPGLGNYNPKYDYVRKDNKCVIFDNQTGRDHKSVKKSLVQRVIHSYNINEDYSVVKLKMKADKMKEKKPESRLVAF